MYKVYEVPKIGNSDIFLKFISLFNNGDFASNNKVVCEFESSKTIFDFQIDEEGFFYSFNEDGDSVRVGEPFALISKMKLSEVEFIEIKNKYKSNPNNSLTIDNIIGAKVITNGAKKLIDDYNLNINDFSENLINERIVNNMIKSQIIPNQFSSHNFQDSDILIYGIGGHAGMCIDIISSNADLTLKGYLDENESINNKYGLNYFGKLSDLDTLIKNGLKNIVIGTAFFENISKRQNIFKEISSKINIPNIIHSSAIIENSAILGKGCQILAGSIIGSNVVIGDNCIINSGAIISHDTSIGHSCHVAPGACIAGGVKVGERVLIGMCSTIFLGLNISSDVVIKNNDSVIVNI